eukprot:scaffold260785_cov31-Tisochrysis_lutea.AAC.4
MREGRCNGGVGTGCPKFTFRLLLRMTATGRPDCACDMGSAACAWKGADWVDEAAALCVDNDGEHNPEGAGCAHTRVCRVTWHTDREARPGELSIALWSMSI